MMNIIPEMRLEYYIGYLCLYYYHMIYTTDGGLLVLECIIRPVVSVSITGSLTTGRMIHSRTNSPPSVV
jgi:hypothetical protein